MIDFTRLTIVFTCVLILLFITNLTSLAQEVKTSPLPEPVPKPFVAEGVSHQRPGDLWYRNRHCRYNPP